MRCSKNATLLLLSYVCPDWKVNFFCMHDPFSVEITRRRHRSAAAISSRRGAAARLGNISSFSVIWRGVAHTPVVLEAQFLHVRGIKSSQKTLICTDYH
jgi:hypothetical protein